MKQRWDHGLPKTTGFILGLPRSFDGKPGDDLLAMLERAFPHFTFLPRRGSHLFPEPHVMPLCGTITDDGRGEVRGMPSRATMDEINSTLAEFLGRIPALTH